MYYDFMLNTGDQATLQILRMLNEEPTHRLERVIVAQRLGLTNYQLNKSLVTLNQDLAAVADETPSFIDESTKGTWVGHHITTLLTQRIHLLYLRRASLFPVFEFRAFYDHQDIKASVYAQEHFQTESTFYKNDRKLKKLLKANDFYSISGINQDPEFIVRLRLFQLYYTAFTGLDRPLPQLNDCSDQLVAALQQLFTTPMAPTQKVKLETLIKIWLLRQQNQAVIKTPQLAANLHDATYQAVSDTVHRLLDDTLSVPAAEIDYLFSFLLTQGFLALPDVTSAQANFPLADQLTRQFIQQVDDKAVLTADTDLSATDLYNQLLAVNLQFTAFYVEPTTFISADQITFFKRLYPTFDLLIRDFLNTLKQTVHFKLGERMIVNLYFSYMFCLINTIPTTSIKDRVYIFVDFSEGQLYTNYVIKSLRAFSHAHIIIEKQLSAKTDIYISDFRSMAVNVPQIIWLDPPTAQDWSDLADVILAVKQTRLKKFFPNYDWSD